ncbi:hypothetical protein ABZ816_03170 [Actinosynnema sp. NPDC047251]|uniref:hypothetical protein n=1 Tax=Saccharothrix espanaensis TaxID=103731 RepID=UPI0011DCB919|nr:hypothetical protein [Saccharothrix espanaensis]
MTARSPGAAPAAVQRLVLYADQITEIDDVISADLAFQQAMARARPRGAGAVLTLDALEHPGFRHAIEPDEAVVVIGHGLPGLVQGRSAQDIARSLRRVGNIQHASFVYIASCDAAVDQPGRLKSSVVDVTATVLASLRQEGMPVYGAPGAAVNDFTGVTGDRQAYAFPETDAEASALELLVINAEGRHDIKEARGFTGVAQAAAHGAALIEDPEFLGFYGKFVGAVSGADRRQLVRLRHQYHQLTSAAGARFGWPTWLVGWITAAERRTNKRMDDRTWLAMTKKRLAPAGASIQKMLADPKVGFLSQARKGKQPLRKAGGHSIGYNRIAADAEFYRNQRETMRNHGTVDANTSIRPPHDWSSAYIG